MLEIALDLNVTYSVLLSLFSSQEASWNGLVYYMRGYYYNLTGIVFYVYSVYNLKIYSELSIYVFFMLLQHTPIQYAQVNISDGRGSGVFTVPRN